MSRLLAAASLELSGYQRQAVCLSLFSPQFTTAYRPPKDPSEIVRKVRLTSSLCVPSL